jgi:AraC family transcriptional regulator
MQVREAEPGPESIEAVLSGARRVNRQWNGLRAECAWRPPFRGSALTKPNRVEVVFSAHDDVIIDQRDHAYDVRVPPGGMYVVGEQPTTLLHTRTYSDTLEMYPDLALVRDVARARGVRAFELEPTLRGRRPLTFARDPVVLGVAHVLRRACMNRSSIGDVEAGDLAHVLAERIVTLQHADARHSPAPQQLSSRTIAEVGEYIEAGLTGRLTLEELARVAKLSPFHFARCFKATTGLAPHQYVLARRIELAKRLIMTTSQSVQDTAWAAGFENISHFRRQFAAQVGVVPGLLRRATCQRSGARAATSQAGSRG